MSILFIPGFAKVLDRVSVTVSPLYMDELRYSPDWSSAGTMISAWQ